MQLAKNIEVHRVEVFTEVLWIVIAISVYSSFIQFLFYLVFIYGWPLGFSRPPRKNGWKIMSCFLQHLYHIYFRFPHAFWSIDVISLQVDVPGPGSVLIFKCPEPMSVLQDSKSTDIYSQRNIGMSCSFQYYDHCIDSHNVQNHSSFSQGLLIYVHPSI
jgi:hypothetical protein